jgi:uncharacterized protein YjbI with pentapeptide repeats/beta-lactamase regulating signal transducer with metallopeptidase domain
MIEAIVSAALQAIVFSVVLGAVLFGLVFALVRTVPLRAAARHAAWTIALVTTAVMPLAALGASVVRTLSAPTPMSVSTTHVRTSPTSHVRSAAAQTAPAKAAPVTTATAPHFSFTMPAWRVHLTRVAALVVIAIWLAGVVVGLAGLVSSLFRVQGLKKRSSPLDGALADDLPWLTENHVRDREIYLRLSYETETPVAIGLGRPVILIPTELATHNGLAAIDQLIRHEHAHLRRYDDWTNLLQRVIERFFWFNPIVWLVGARIALEREIASDDAVVDETGHAAEYAKSLWRLAREMRMPEHAVVAPGALLTRKQITIRIESLLESRPTFSRFTPLISLGIGALAFACIIVAGVSAPAFELPAHDIVTVPAQPAAPAVPHVSATAARLAPETVHSPPAVAHQAQAKPVVKPLAVTTPAAHVAVSKPPKVVAYQPVSPVLSQKQGDEIAKIPETVSQTVARAMRDSGNLWESTPPPALKNSTLAQILASCGGCDLSGRDLRGVDLRHLRVTGADLSGADLRDAKLDGVVFTGVDLSGAKLSGASLVDAHFIGVDISGISFRGTNIAGLTMTGVSLAHMDFRNLDARALLNACTGCDLSGANLSNLDLHGVRLVGADLSGAKLDGANLNGATLEGADLKNASVHNTDFRNASFSGASLSGVNLRDANTTGAHFTGVDLRGVTFK